MRLTTFLLVFLGSVCSSANGCDGGGGRTPFPPDPWSFERHVMVQLHQARNRGAITYSYVINPSDGAIMWSCTSRGFPTSVQGSSGTWVLCVGDDGNLEPAYIEEHVRTFTRPMEDQEGRLVPVAGQRSTVAISPRRGGNVTTR